MTDEPQHIVWIEIATRGDTDDIADIGVAVTNGSLGVIAEAPRLTGTPAEIETQALALLGEHVAKGAAPLGSRSAQRVRHLLRTHMPALYDFLHYRSVDLMTLRQLASRWYPDAPPPPAAGTVHASIDELRYYRANVFK